MAIPVLHTITVEADRKIMVDTSVYQRGVGEPPKFHVWCTCQWEGWTHDQRVAVGFMMSHRHAQIVRGNVVTLCYPEGWQMPGEGAAGVAEAAGNEPERIVMSAEPKTAFDPNGNPNVKLVLPQPSKVDAIVPTNSDSTSLTTEQKVLRDKLEKERNER